jgi:hypothetical protein
MVGNMKNTFNDSSLKKFGLKLAAFFLVIIIADKMIGFVLKKYYYNQVAGYDYETTFAIDKTVEETIIVGSSRAANLFNPDIFEKSLNISCYNAGRYGYPIFYHYAILKVILKRYSPKLVVLSFDAGNFSINNESYDRIATLLPYYKTHPELKDIIELKGPYENIKMLSSIYPYNSLLLPIISGSTEYSKKKYANIKGYIPVNEVIKKGPLMKFDYSKEKDLDTVKINIYKAFIQRCIDSNIKLYIVCPPYLINAIGVDRSISEAKEIAQKNGIKFLDYSRDTFYTHKPDLFYDYRHLNATGVEIFSNDVIKKMKTDTSYL